MDHSSLHQWAPWAGCAAGALGSLLLATKSRASGWGFVVYLVSNVAWISVGLVTGMPALCVQGLIYSCRRRSKFEPPCRLNFEPGWNADRVGVDCG